MVRRGAPSTFSDLTDEEVRAAKNPLVPHCQFPEHLRPLRNRRIDDKKYIEELEAATTTTPWHRDAGTNDLLLCAHGTLFSYQSDRGKPAVMRDYPAANFADPARHAIASSVPEAGHPRISKSLFNGHEFSHPVHGITRDLRNQVLGSRHEAHVQFGQRITHAERLDGMQEGLARV